MALNVGRQSGPPGYGARLRGYEAPDGCAGRRCGAKFRAPPQFPSRIDAGRRDEDSRAGRGSALPRVEPSHRRAHCLRAPDRCQASHPYRPTQSPPRPMAILPSIESWRLLYAYTLRSPNIEPVRGSYNDFVPDPSGAVANPASEWWRGLDSNQRTLARADLQSAAFNHSATSPRGLPRADHPAMIQRGEGRRAMWRGSGGVSTREGPLIVHLAGRLACAPISDNRPNCQKLERVKGIEPSS